MVNARVVGAAAAIGGLGAGYYYFTQKPKSSIDPVVAAKLEAGFQKLQNAADCKSLLKKYLTQDVFEKTKNLTTPTFGSTLLDVIQSGVENLDSGVGIYAPDAEAYNTFGALFNPIIEHYHVNFGPNDKHPACDFGDVNAIGKHIS